MPAGRQGRQGVGLGLAIVASLVKAMGGEVSVRSAPGEGTAFAVVLPVADTL
jgi:two-component system OmpR family sensor kinase